LLPSVLRMQPLNWSRLKMGKNGRTLTPAP